MPSFVESNDRALIAPARSSRQRNSCKQCLPVYIQEYHSAAATDIAESHVAENLQLGYIRCGKPQSVRNSTLSRTSQQNYLHLVDLISNSRCIQCIPRVSKESGAANKNAGLCLGLSARLRYESFHINMHEGEWGRAARLMSHASRTTRWVIGKLKLKRRKLECITCTPVF